MSFLVVDLDKGETLASPRSSFSLAVNVVVAGLGDDLAGLGSDGERREGLSQCGVVNGEGEVGDEKESLEK